MQCKPVVVMLMGVLCAVAGMAQNLTRSPYSGFGVGDLQFFGFAQQQGMGRIGQSIRSIEDFSPSNPASYGALQKANYQAGIYAYSAKMANSTQTQTTQSVSLGYFALGVPINMKRGWGAAFGLTPYSAVGYKSYNSTTDTLTGNYINQQEGSGGINRFYMGTGIRLLKNLSVGANASYLFGQLVTTNKVYFQPDSSYIDYREDRSRFLGGFNFDVGLQYHDTLIRDTSTIRNNSWVINVGATYNFGSDLRARQQLYARTIFATQDIDYRRDTVAFSDNVKGKLSIPYGYSIGIGIGNSGKTNRCFFALEYQYQNWKNYSSYGQNANLADYMGFSAGASFQPKYADFETDITKKYYKFIQYRAGVRYAKTQLMVDNTRINEYGINFGLSLPVKPFRIVSYIHLTAEYSSRGIVKDNLIKEDYYRFILGFTLNDRWFIKYKYD